MNTTQIRQLKPKRAQFLHRFDACFPRKDTRAPLPVSVTGQWSDIPQKSVEPIALEAGVAPRTLPEFLSQLPWDHDTMRDRLQGLVRDEHAGPRAIGIFDETSDVQNGDKTPGVKRQSCGAVGKTENCIVTVHLGYAHDGFHCRLDSAWDLPKDGAQDRPRCREAGIPDNRKYQPQWRIARELFDRAIGNGLHFEWMTFDEGYGGKPGLLQGLSARRQRFVGEVPCHFVGWLKPPRIVTRPFHKHGRGRGRKVPRLAADSPPAWRVDELLGRRAWRDQPWRRWRITDGDQGPLVWEVKPIRFTPTGEDDLPGEPMHRIVARDVLNPAEVQFFVSNAPAETPVPTLLRVGLSRWRVARCFEDQKGEIGLDHDEGRRYVGLKRQRTLSAVSSLFLARMRQEFGGEKFGADGVPGPHRDRGVSPLLVARPGSLGEAAGADVGADPEGASPECLGAQVPHQEDATEIAEVRCQTH